MRAIVVLHTGPTSFPGFSPTHLRREPWERGCIPAIHFVRYRRKIESLVLSATLADFYINLKSCRHSYQIFCCLIKKLKKNITLFLKKTSFNVYLEEFFRFIIYSITLKRRGVRVKGAVLSKCRILKNDISAIIHESPFLAMGWT